MDSELEGDTIIVASSPSQRRDMTKTRLSPAITERDPTPFIKQEGTPVPAPAPPCKKAKDYRRISESGRHDHAREMDTDAKSVKSDLEGFGFGKKNVGDMIKRKDVSDIYVSGAKVARAGATAEGEEKKGRTAKGKAKSSGAPAYEPLCLAEGTNWVLFDPNRGYPSTVQDRHNDETAAHAPPAIFQRFETYRPGNARIVEFNTVSRAVRLRSTPAVLVAREVRYERFGPRVVDVVTGGRKGRQAGSSGLRRVVESSDGEEGSDVENREV
ncbi:hypothetical protein Tdes44962_MAKER00574 [Teratosphaeria destructans]|uniref:Uncharacterized protein n=1 Tax=Teratosphaeria destructans TaxID=418781 RepID=A0A9W7SQ07_9PEZI|nr:hypothetical protein Tdes44962_MAKER00574 [Teratosphaeria destructans]